MKKISIMFKISAIVAMIFGVIYCISLVFIPVGIYCFIAYKRFLYESEHLLDNFGPSDDVIKNYVIFVSIVCFPIGLVSIAAYKMSTSNNIKVEKNDLSYSQTQSETNDDKSEETVEVEIQKEETESEKNEKFEKLKNFYEKGIITEDELEMAREQLFGKKDE